MGIIKASLDKTGKKLLIYIREIWVINFQEMLTKGLASIRTHQGFSFIIQRRTHRIRRYWVNTVNHQMRWTMVSLWVNFSQQSNFTLNQLQSAKSSPKIKSKTTAVQQPSLNQPMNPEARISTFLEDQGAMWHQVSFLTRLSIAEWEPVPHHLSSHPTIIKASTLKWLKVRFKIWTVEISKKKSTVIKTLK